jgi:hypothetical protein
LALSKTPQFSVILDWAFWRWIGLSGAANDCGADWEEKQRPSSSFETQDLRNPWTLAAEYLVDAGQRSILFWDVMRQRGNQYREQLATQHYFAFPVANPLCGSPSEKSRNCRSGKNPKAMKSRATPTSSCPRSIFELKADLGAGEERR